MVPMSLPGFAGLIEPYLPALLAVLFVAVLAFFFRNAMDTAYAPAPVQKKKIPRSDISLFGDGRQVR